MSTDAITVLKSDHKEIKSLFREFEAAGRPCCDVGTCGALCGKLLKSTILRLPVSASNG